MAKKGKSNIPREMKERLYYLLAVSQSYAAAVTEKGWLPESTGRTVLGDQLKGAPEVDTLIRLVRGMGFDPAVIFTGPYASDEMPQYFEASKNNSIVADSGGAERSYIHTENRVDSEAGNYSEEAFEEWKLKVPYFYCGRVDGSSIAEQLLAKQMEDDRRKGIDRMQEIKTRVLTDAKVGYYPGYYVEPGTPLNQVPQPEKRKY